MKCMKFNEVEQILTAIKHVEIRNFLEEQNIFED